MGTLYLVPTPVGNMEDITLRALRTLREVDVILAEDTRTSSNLLRHHDIHTPLQAHHMHNEHHTAPILAERLLSGENMALVTDAGSPGISDPGFLLVRECARRGIPVVALPGPTAFVPALTASALPSERFCFEGFLPQKKGRATRLARLAEEERTILIYESPYRILRTLSDIAAAFGEDRPAAACREISKIHEEVCRGTVQQLIEHFQANPPKGEFVLVIGGKNPKTELNSRNHE